MKFKTSVILRSNLSEIKNTIEGILHSMGEFLKQEDLIFDIRLILNELVINSAIHGNNLDESKKIELKIEINDSSIKVEVVDEGEGFTYDKNAYNPLDLNPNGRGLVIVDGLSDELLIESNRVEVVKYYNPIIS
ncbi:putative anti-sigma F factor [Gottschalkia acidurici 9a]|uniref:Anti-sigma F factor n=1 Tax=Gottschalkia acidurici (strain ATCC 7906 / DSM 604 / BCRC 14475 / CIP 104303 / KCTC 5404 / NCIMB 10678 / 9a) TaxID=1128398 RepID=K0AZ11_GOTA9|nr:ATP-binding protein [Gottschalkia acidurici]AFS77641.1 putative anti-sigma F factor [Gottschalkia acidurici 9a]